MATDQNIVCFAGEDLEPGEEIGFASFGPLGDVVAHTALIAAFKEQHPDAKVYVHAEPYSAGVWDMNPYIEGRCAEIETGRWIQPCRRKKWLFSRDMFKCYSDKSQSSSVYASMAENYHTPLSLEQSRPRLFVASDEVDALWIRLSERVGRDMRGEKFLLFAPTSGSRYRCWPAYNNFVEMVQSELGLTVLAVTVGANAAIVEELNEKAICLCNFLTTRELIVLCSKASRIVTVDTAVVHIGAAFNIPTVVISGPISPTITVGTYPKCVAVFHKERCPKAPCGWLGVDQSCPIGASECAVMAGASPRTVLDKFGVLAL